MIARSRPPAHLWLSSAAAFLLFACDSGGGGSPWPTDGAPGVETDSGLPDLEDLTPSAHCAHIDLTQQCPLGSVPRELSAGCIDGSIVRDAAEGEAGLCVHNGACIFSCAFQDPCTCGIDRIDRDGILCADCSRQSACGDAVCDRGETPESCPEDCGAVCEPGAERCDGHRRQVCNENTRWESLNCREDQFCDFTQGDQGRVLTVCQTRISPSGGVFHGLGQIPAPPTEESAQIRFAAFDVSPPAPEDWPRGVPYPVQLGLRFVAQGTQLVGLRQEDSRDDLWAIHHFALPLSADGHWGEGALDPGEPWRSATDTHLLQIGPTLTLATSGRWPVLQRIGREHQQTLEPVVHDGATVRFGALQLSPDERLIIGSLAVGMPGQPAEPLMAIWRSEDGRIERLLRFVDRQIMPGEAPASFVALSQNNEIAVELRRIEVTRGQARSFLIVWQVETGRYVQILESNITTPRAMILSSEGQDRLTISGDQGVELWRLGEQPRTLWRLPGEDASYGHAAFSPDGRVLALARQTSEGAHTALVELSSGRTLTTLGGDPSTALAFHPSGRLLLVTGQRRSVIYGTE